MPSINQITGEKGEKLAERYLLERGYTILTRNYRFKRVEIDLVCRVPAGERKRECEIVFVEVKTRKSRSFGFPEEAVTRSKQKNLILAARAYIHDSRLHNHFCRFDVVSVTVKSQNIEIEHFRDAFH